MRVEEVTTTETETALVVAPVNTQANKPPEERRCWYFFRAVGCNNGDQCKFSHDDARTPAPDRRHKHTKKQRRLLLEAPPEQQQQQKKQRNRRPPAWSRQEWYSTAPLPELMQRIPSVHCPHCWFFMTHACVGDVISRPNYLLQYASQHYDGY
jgi:hypothetical protein